MWWQTEYEGNLEICSAHGLWTWSALGDSSWSSVDVVVACRQLGYTNTSEVLPVFSADKDKICRTSGMAKQWQIQNS